MFEKITKPTRIYQDVALRIEDAIISRKLSPGDKLPSERELAKTFGISHRTLREALRLVEEKGLLETSQSGNVVKAITTDVISHNLELLVRSKKISWEHMLQFRLDLDKLITARAVQVATEKDVQEIEQIVADLNNRDKVGTLDWDTFLALDRAYHLTVSRIAGNPVHQWVMRTVVDDFFRYYGEFRIHEESFIQDNPHNLQRDLAGF